MTISLIKIIQILKWKHKLTLAIPIVTASAVIVKPHCQHEKKSITNELRTHSIYNLLTV